MFDINLTSKKIPYVGRDNSAYVSIRDGASLSGDEGDQEEKEVIVKAALQRTGRFWTILVILLLITTNVSTLVSLLAIRHLGPQLEPADPLYTPKSWAQVDTLPIKWTRFNWWTEYSERNFTETDALWDDINPAHGFIAVNRKWAKSKHWPDSMHLPDTKGLPSDGTKNVYLLEAYHLLHCVTVIRKTFWQAVHGEEYYFRPPHAGHCIDILRQYVICKADNTPLYVFGDDTAGDEQYRKCNNWDALRQFATENSACYRDTPAGVNKDTFALGSHFGYCDGGYDGVKDGERRGPWKHGAVFDGPL